MDNREISEGASKNNQLHRAAADGSGSALLGPEDDPFGRVATYVYDLNPRSARSRRRKRKGAGVGKKAKAAGTRAGSGTGLGRKRGRS
jgi:hypothetical protein